MKLVYVIITKLLFLLCMTQLWAAPCVGDYDLYEGGSDSNTWTQMTVKQTGWNYAHFLILRSEISICDPNVITSISFYRTRRDDCETDWPETEVWLRETTATSLSANEDPPPSRATLVYGDLWRQNLVGWQELRFNVSNFSWSSGNLEIWVKEENTDTGGYSPYYSTTAIGKMQEGYGYSGYYISATTRFDIRLNFLGGTPGPTATPTVTPTITPSPTPPPLPATNQPGRGIILVLISIVVLVTLVITKTQK